MKYYIKYKYWNTKTDKIEIIKHEFERSFNDLKDLFDFIDDFKSSNCIYRDQVIEIDKI